MQGPRAGEDGGREIIANKGLPLIALVILAALGVITMPGRAATATETTLTVVAEEGSPTPVGGTYSNFGGLAVNDLGHVAFVATIDGGSTTDAIFLYDGLALSKVVAVGDPAPTGGTFIRIAFPDLNNHDDVVFAGETEDAIATTTAIYLASDSGVGKVVAEGDPTPVGGTYSGCFLCTGIGVGDGIVEPKISLNDSGDVGFGDKVVDGDVTGALFVWSGGSGTKIVAIGESTPIGGSFFLVAGPDLNDLGQAGFMGWTGGTGTDPAGVFLGNTTLLRNGVPSPVGGTIAWVCCTPHVNDAGQAASWIRLADNREGILLGDGATTTKVMIEGEAAPELGGTFAAPTLDYLDLNDRGQVAFAAVVLGGSEPWAIWAYSEGVLKPAIVPSDGGTSAWGVPVLNNEGQIAFSDSSAGKIFLATVPDLCPDGSCGGGPEPTPTPTPSPTPTPTPTPSCYAPDPARSGGAKPIAELLEPIGAKVWQRNGTCGNGVKVGVLDYGFVEWDVYLPSDLIPQPGEVNLRSFRRDNSNGARVHGTKVARLVHDVAPRADMYLAAVEPQEVAGSLIHREQALEALGWFESVGVDIVVASIGWMGEGLGDGSSWISQEIERMKASGVLWVNAAGNEAKDHYEASFYDADGDSRHNFKKRVNALKFCVGEGDLLGVYVTWDDPWDGSTNDYDLTLYTPTGLASSFGRQDGEPSDHPLEQIRVVDPPSGCYSMEVSRYSASTENTLTIFVSMDAKIRTGGLDPEVLRLSSIPPGPDSAGSLTVGASSKGSWSKYSSCGPTDDGRTKPELLAPMGYYSPVSGDGWYGTSAAAPVVVGVAALMLSDDPSLSPDQIISSLRGSAEYVRGDARCTGAGEVRLPTP